jgi:hypothetical protein
MMQLLAILNANLNFCYTSFCTTCEHTTLIIAVR